MRGLGRAALYTLSRPLGSLDMSDFTSSLTRDKTTVPVTTGLGLHHMFDLPDPAVTPTFVRELLDKAAASAAEITIQRGLDALAGISYSQEIGKLRDQRARDAPFAPDVSVMP